jgi:hypothetical protein
MRYGPHVNLVPSAAFCKHEKWYFRAHSTQNCQKIVKCSGFDSFGSW